ncbi:hypothetical protein [uncultured Roseovarius sp.]|nr:hypothetical protein [uncultured Roseovarius sp.]
MRGICEIVIAAASVLMTLAAVALADRPAMALLSGARVVLVPQSVSVFP